jgi:PIN domain nuclease of toxin-antitoxin system
LGRDDFKVDSRALHRGLLDNGYSELPIVSSHIVAIESLPMIYNDPFDRVLVAQATVEGITLRPAGFFRRHLRRFGSSFAFISSQECAARQVSPKPPGAWCDGTR